MSSLADKTILIIGLGMIGGSIARAIRDQFPGQTILASDSDALVLEQAIADGTINKGGSLEELLPEADLCVLAVPPLTLLDVIPELAEKCQPGAVITDVGSVKSHILSLVNKIGGEFAENFVPGHPIAGSEQSGYNAADGSLFRGRKTILTPQANTSTSAVALVNQLWRAIGSEVLGMSPEKHDQVLAATSHLPHLLAFAIVDVLLHQEASDDIFRYAAGGFADFSRVASSDAKMWSDVFVANAEATEEVLDKYIEALQSLKLSIQEKDHAALKTLFSRAKRTRDEFVRNHYGNKDEEMESQDSLTLQVESGGKVEGRIRVPGDKSISHRSVIFGSLADGITEVSGFLEGEDALKTVAAFRAMGVTIIGPEKGSLKIYGVGVDGLNAPDKPLDMGNSGTAMRLLAGLLASQSFDSELYGDASLNSRPMGRIADPLSTMGASIETEKDGTPPLKIKGQKLKGKHYDMPVASAQVKSALLLAGMNADGETSITEPAVCRDHTERMLRGFGYSLAGGFPDSTVALHGGKRLQATSIDVPADISSAAFFLVAASIAPGSDLLLEHVGINPTRIGIINLLQEMGANISVQNEREVGGERVADLRVVHSQLRGIAIPVEQVPLAIDEFPVLFIAAACAEGETILHGAEELRVKESDRIAAMADGLQVLGIEVETYDDGIRIVGGILQAGTINSLGDHRIAMAFAVAGLRAVGPITILNAENVATSFPNFVELASGCGMQISGKEQ